MPKVLLCGTRTWTNYAPIAITLARLQEQGDLKVIVGTRRNEDAAKNGDLQIGVDRIVHDLVVEGRIPHVVVDAQWDRLGRAAGPIRNRAMLDLEPDLVVAFWIGASRGTEDTVTEARRRGIPVEIIRPSRSDEREYA